MSILIKGMEMPKNCKDCIFCVNNWCVINSRLHHIKGAEETTQYCPLVPVPPHVDLIDRRDLKNKEITINYDEWDDTFDDGLLFVTSLIDNAPTIIEAEENEDG